MMSDTNWRAFAQRFPTLRSEEKSEGLLRTNEVLRTVGPGEILYRDGDECTHLPMVISGELVLTKHAETGRSIPSAMTPVAMTPTAGADGPALGSIGRNDGLGAGSEDSG
jgi:hypothetical protein